MEKQHFDLSSTCIHVYLNLMHPCTDGCCLDDGYVQPCIGDAVILMIQQCCYLEMMITAS